ncbi:hypothetical protein HNO88_002387 [Novosphingobium chloroacetimidivorans]|uniref:XRE family transcriptional regulator n=1 Tax=Novosphingobium chloroacetimidivorans TaxID=1428314 RepID=A0A7W7KA92_9SPHN|nr:hypothetical protein [Novosphingobium chloroacetimidivorans]MBB4859061.1 hypothetical protein [Novosphingobium chloroacetimidivorans]
MILSQVERFLRATGMPWTRFGRLAAGDPRLVADMRNGRVPRPSMEARLEQFMNTYKEEHHVR